MDKGETHTQTLLEHYSAIRTRSLPFGDARVDLESVVFSEVSQKKDKYSTISLVCGVQIKQSSKKQKGEWVSPADGEMPVKGSNF